MCKCIAEIEEDAHGKIKEFIAKKKATVKELKLTGLCFPLIRMADGSTKLGYCTSSKLEVKTNEKKRPIIVDIMHTFCPFCGVKYD
jgi:hypothetical protein